MKYADVKIGMEVMVMGTAEDHSEDAEGLKWLNGWLPEMDEYIGGTYTVNDIGGYGVRFEGVIHSFPWSVLKPVLLAVTDQTPEGAKVVITERVKGDSPLYVPALDEYIGKEFTVVRNLHGDYPSHTILGNTVRITDGSSTFVLPYHALDLLYSEETAPPAPLTIPPLVDKDKKIKIKKPWISDDLDEIYSSDMWKFALLTSNNEMAMPWVMCRDFIQECVGAHLNDHNIRVYGFKTHPEEHPKPSLAAPRMAIKHDNKGRYDDLDVAKHIVHLFEGAMKVKKSQISRAEWQVDQYHTPEEVYVIHFSKLWLKSPQMISLYSLLWRLGDNFKTHEISQMRTLNQFLKLMKANKVSNNNRKYFQSLLQYEGRFVTLVRSFRKVFKRSNVEYFNYKVYNPNDIHKYHNYSGIQSMFEANALIPYPEVKNFIYGATATATDGATATNGGA